MNKPETLVDIFSDWLDETSRRAILIEAHIEDDRPPHLRGEGGDLKVAWDWIQHHRAQIAPLVLRYVDPPDRVVEGLVMDGDLQVPHPEGGVPSVLSFSPLTEFETSVTQSPGQIPVLDLALTSAFVSELFVDMARANRVCGTWVDPPQAAVTRGSVQYTLGSGLFASGMGLLVACSAGLVGAPIVGPVAGATLATVGLFDLALGWRKQVAETTKARSAARKYEAEARLVELDVKIKEVELEKARLLSETEPEYDRHKNVLRRIYVRRRHEEFQRILAPDSGEVPRQLVRRTAEDMNMNEVYANHLLNRCLPRFRLLKQKIAGATITSRNVRRKRQPRVTGQSGEGR